MAKLQRIQTTVARIILNTQRLCVFPSQQLLWRLYWLPVYFRINYKTATLTYKVLTFNQPLYLTDTQVPYSVGLLFLRKRNTSSHSLQFPPS